MKKMDLQRFASLEAVQGTRIIYLYRLLEDAATTDAKAIAFSTEDENTISRDADTTQTKSGPIRTPGATEVEISLTSIMAKGDNMVDKAKDAVVNGKLVELWQVNLDEAGTGENADKFKATYYQGYFTELGVTANSEEATEISMTFGANGVGADGYAEVTAEQQEVASYVFKDVKKEGEKGA